MPSAPLRRLLAINFALTILLSAFLLFQVQPIISKCILPWFGGSPAVWSTCMVFFQVVLFLGYAYAHLNQKLRQPRMQAAVHLMLIVAAIVVLPILPTAAWKPSPDASPTLRILCLLAATVGLPYFVLSSTGPLVQAWFSRVFPGRSPYRLYALSNFGSLLALVSYPFVVEPALDVSTQGRWWSVGFVAFGGLCAAAALVTMRAKPQVAGLEGVVGEPVLRPSASQRWLWLGLPAFASMMLLATTNHVCQDVAVIPFLWVAPLSLYLLSFIITFDHDRWYSRRFWSAAALILLGAVVIVDQLITAGAGVPFSFAQELTLYFAALFAICMVCHGELARLKPHPQFLTSFYLMISAGGAIGGLFVSLVAPVIFSTFFEWKLGLVGGCVIAAVVVLLTGGRISMAQRRRLLVGAPLLMVIFTGLNCVPHLQPTIGANQMICTRSFYGTANVVERDAENPAQHKFQLYSGRIVHGVQFVAEGERDVPRAYYGRESGIGRVFDALADRERLYVGAVGLGAGTIAAYARPDDEFRFYEINPQMVKLAKEHFTFLRDCRGSCPITLGDARLSLESEPSQQFDLLVLDAFSGDAVPTHLLTREAMDIYRRHVNSDGAIAMHVSNRYLDLIPVVRQLAAHAGLKAIHISSTGDAGRGIFPAEWIVLSENEDLLGKLQPFASSQSAEKAIALWTDSHSNLFEILK